MLWMGAAGCAKGLRVAAPLHENCWSRLLVDEEAGGGEDHADGGDGHAAEPEEALFGEERDGADDQAHFQEDFAAVETVGAVADEVALGFQFLGLIADGVFVFFVALDFLDVFFVDGGDFFFVAGGEDGEHVGDGFHLVEANIFGLVVGPLVAGFGLEEEFFGVGAMAEESDDGAEDGDDGDGYGDGDGERVMVRVFFLFGEFDAFGHFVGASFRIGR